MDRKRELKLQYKQMKHDMGIFIVRSKLTNKCYIETAQNLKARMNSTMVKLESSFHPYQELNKAWKQDGVENFTIEILEYLEYDKDETKTDYTDDLALLQMEWEEKLAKEGLVFYNKYLKK